MSRSAWISTIILLMLLMLKADRPLLTASAQTPADPRFGIVEAFWAQEEAAELNVGWERILFYWRELQPTGPEDWNTLHVLEEWLGQANAQGRAIVGLIKNTPPWASEDGTEAGLPQGLYLDIDDPGNLWANFVRRVATYYSVRNVHHWIIWNEPEIPTGVYGHEFAGTVADYFRMLKVAYLVMKEADPDAVIHLAGLTWWHDQAYLDRLLQTILQDPDAERNNYYFDAISLHIYFRAETVKTITEQIQRIQTNYGLDKPIWITETNAPPNRDPEWPIDRLQFDVNTEQQAWFIVQAYALGFAAGAEKIGVYKLLDISLSSGEESFGLLRPDYSRRPAFQAYKTAIRYLSGFDEVSRQQAADYFMITFHHPGKITRVLWARTPSPVTVKVPALSNNAQFVDSTGESLTISPIDDTYTFTLKEATCFGECIIGGPPIFLIESVDVSDISLVPTATSLEDVSVTPVAATQTPTPTATMTRTPRPTRTPTPSPTPLPTPTSTPTIRPSPTPGEVIDEVALGITEGSRGDSTMDPSEASETTSGSTPQDQSTAQSLESTNNPSNLGVVLATLVIVIILAAPITKRGNETSSR